MLYQMRYHHWRHQPPLAAFPGLWLGPPTSTHSLPDSRLQFCSPQCQNVRNVFKEAKGGRLFLDPSVARPCSVGNACSASAWSPSPVPKPLTLPVPSVTCQSQHPPTCADPQRQLPAWRPQDSRHQVASPGSSPAGPTSCLRQPGRAAAALSQADCSAAAAAPCFLPHFLPAPGASDERQACACFMA